ncbi:MAG: sensor histidine kinase [Lachnospiraceae bacterium]|nr:sensor histidine kinase [Lachnospiraceae bacterium]
MYIFEVNVVMMYDTAMKKDNITTKNTRKIIKEKLDKTPLWVTFIFLTAFFLLCLTFGLSYSNYRWNRNRTIRENIKETTSLLELKIENMEEYLNELSDFCVLPVRDSYLYREILKTKKLNVSELERIMNTLRVYYYTRNDLMAYNIYLLNQDVCIGRNYGNQRMKITEAKSIRSLAEYKSCVESGIGSAITSSQDNSLLTFYHTIIRIPDRYPVALVKIEVDDTALTLGLAEKNIALYKDKGTLLFTNANSDLKYGLSKIGNIPKVGKNNITSIGGKKYLFSSASSKKYGISLVAYTPMEDITDDIKKDGRFSVMQGLTFLLISLIITYFIIRFLTEPFSILISSHENFGENEFSKINIGRSLEVARLSESFNLMSERMEKLINENLIASINEKSAQLSALEAQVNPHFLYNTLQAIGSEALINDQDIIYEMVTKLAQNLRYSIKAPNRVKLREEMVFAQNYIDLQQVRMGDRLVVEKNISDELLDVEVPKCCIQPIIENSIKHGISGDRRSIKIKLSAMIYEGQFIIRVSDDGIGMSPNTLAALRASFDDTSFGNRQESIGLANLYSRLKIMYGYDAGIDIKSIAGEGTTVILILCSQEDDNASSVNC